MNAKEQYREADSIKRYLKRKYGIWNGLANQCYYRKCWDAGVSFSISMLVIYSPWCETRQVRT